MPDTATATPQVNPLDPAGAAGLAKYFQSIFAPEQTAQNDLLKKISVYDPSSALDAIAKLSPVAGNIPTGADQAASDQHLVAGGANDLLDRMKAVDAPHGGMISQPDLPTLSLPNQPETARPQGNILSTLLTIGAGLAAPKSAGQFNAATLEGQLKGATEENQRRQMFYKNDVASRTMLYDAAMSAAKERERVTEINQDTANQNSVADFNRKISLAKQTSEALSANKLSEFLDGFAKKYDPALKAQDQIKALYAEISAKGKASTETIDGVTKLLGVLNKENAPGAAITKELLGGMIKNAMEVEKDRRKFITQQEHDTRVENAQRANTSFVQGEEDARLKYSEGRQDARQLNSQSFQINKLDRTDSKKADPQQAEKLRVLEATEKNLMAERAKHESMPSGTDDEKTAKDAHNRLVGDLAKQVNTMRSQLYEGDGKRHLKFRAAPAKKGAKGVAKVTYDPATGKWSDQ